MYYLKNTNSKGGCLCSQQFQPSQPYNSQPLDSDFITSRIRQFWEPQEKSAAMAGQMMPRKYKASSCGVPKIAAKYSVGVSQPVVEKKMKYLSPRQALGPPKYPSAFSVSPNRATQRPLPHMKLVPRERSTSGYAKVGVRYSGPQNHVAYRPAGYQMEHFDVLESEPVNTTSDDQPYETPIVDFGNAIIPTSKPGNVDATLYNDALKAFYDKLGYQNFTPTPVGYDYSYDTEPSKITIDALSYASLPSGYVENFTTAPYNYGAISKW